MSGRHYLNVMREITYSRSGAWLRLLVVDPQLPAASSPAVQQTSVFSTLRKRQGQGPFERWNV